MKNKHAEHLFTKNLYLCFIEKEKSMQQVSNL